MSTDEYEAITEAEWKVLATTEITHLTDEEKDYLPHAWDEWIARVRRDAAREALASAEDRATQAKARIRHLEATAQITVREALRAEAERDEWRQTALDERAAALDALEQIKVRDARAADIWDEGWAQGMAYVTGMERGTDDDHAITNPYRASETA